MDEEELLEYLHAIDALEGYYQSGSLVADALDEDGYRVPGCTYILPAPTEG